MNELSRHIELLLLRHDCVIVPGFGGFVSHRLPARLDKNDMVMLPPTVTVGFNPNLMVNDSLLIQSYIEIHDISYPEAQRLLEDHVSAVRSNLSNNGVWDIHSVGKVTVNDEGKYSFTPCNAGITVPSLYGLSGIDTKDIAYAGKAARTMRVVAKKKNRISNGKSMLHKVAAALIVLLAVSLPFLNHSGITQQAICIPDTGMTRGLGCQDMLTADSKGVVVNDVVEAEKVVAPDTTRNITEAIEKNEVQEELAQPSHALENYFTIVLASKITKKNASKYIAKLEKQGYDSLYAIPDGKYQKVVMGKFNTRDEASASKKKLQKKGNMPKAWIMEVK